MKNQIRIFIACGSGVATSTFAANRIKEICQENDINAIVNHGCTNDIPLAVPNSDVIFTTANYKGELDVPVMSILPLISGIREKQTIEKVVALLKSIN